MLGVIGIPFFWLFTAEKGQMPGKRRLGIHVVDDQTDEVAHRGIGLREVVIKPGLLLLAVGPVLFFGGISLMAGSSANVLRELFSVLPGPWWLLLLAAPTLMCVGILASCR